MLPFPVSSSTPEEYVIPLSPRLVICTYPEKSNTRPFSVFLLPPFSRLPSMSFLITYLFLPWVCCLQVCSHPSSCIPLSLIFMFLFLSLCLSLFLLFLHFFSLSTFPFSSPGLPVSLSTFQFYQVHTVRNPRFRKHHGITEANAVPGLGGEAGSQWVLRGFLFAPHRRLGLEGWGWGTSTMPTSEAWKLILLTYLRLS